MLLPYIKKPGGFPSNCLNSKTAFRTAHGKTSTADTSISNTRALFTLLVPQRQALNEKYGVSLASKRVIVNHSALFFTAYI
jgi:hypothetical protein